MPLKIRSTSATIQGLVLAKVGHPQRDEPLQTSREVFTVDDADQETLAGLFLKPFKNLTSHRFSHHTSLDQHELHACALAVFSDASALLEKGRAMAARLYAKSNHPNIKSGDLCIALVSDLEVNGVMTSAICILKSESVVPFLSISTRDGDLRLSTEQGINPEKIDKGALILNHEASKGCHVLLFDRSGTDSRFWVRDFLAVLPVSDPAQLTRKYADMAVSFVGKERKAAPAGSGDDSPPPWDTCAAARDAVRFFEGKETFSLQEFEEQVLKTPEAAERFKRHRAELEEQTGHKLADTFEISQKDVTRAKRKIGTVIKLDTGVEVHLKPVFADQPEPVIERGFDESKGMKFLRIFYHQDVS
jgi:hypothetical protein